MDGDMLAKNVEYHYDLRCKKCGLVEKADKFNYVKSVFWAVTSPILNFLSFLVFWDDVGFGSSVVECPSCSSRKIVLEKYNPQDKE